LDNKIKKLKEDFKLMFDLVINHVSEKHIWFQEFTRGNPKYRNYFIWFTKDNLPEKKEIQKQVGESVKRYMDQFFN